MLKPMAATAERGGRDSGTRFGRHFSGGLRAGIGPVRGILRGFGPGLAAAFGGAAIVAGIKSVTDEAREAAVVGKQTQAVLKATGGVAHVSAKQIGDLATALSNKVGVDDEAIQSAENLLLTFKGVRNEAGKGNDIFNQASGAIVDMTAAMNNGKVTAEGMKASTIQVGKALNDPIKGITALTRVGVTFTQQQKDQIAAMVKAGNTAGAQKILLAELRSEFGGAAAAAADQGQRFGVFVGNLKEQVGTVLLPIMNRFLGFLVDKLPGALATVGRWLHAGAVGVRALGAAFSGEGVTSTGFVGIMERIGVVARAVVDWFMRTARIAAGILGPAIAGIARALGPAIAAFVQGLLPGLKTLWHMIATQLWPILKALGIVIGVVLYVALAKVLPFILRLAGPVLGFLIGTIAKVIGWITTAVRWLARIGASLLQWITGTNNTGAALRKLGQFAVTVFNSIKTVVGNVITFIIKAIRGWLDVQFAVVAGILHVMGKLPGPMGAPFRKAEEAVKGAKRTVDDQLGKIQARVNRLTGKDIPVTASLKLNFSPSFTQADWAQVKVATRGASGGLVIGPGGPTADRVPALLSAGEFVVNAAAVRQIGVANMKRLNAMRFAGGGVVGTIDAEARGVNRLQARGTGIRMDRGLTKMLKAFGVPGGTASVDRVARWTAAVLGRAAEWAAWARRIMFESGGNWSIVNKWDSNWAAGHPSVGGAQVIRGTFAANAGRFRNVGPFLYGVSINPYANSYAGGHYAIGRYGSLAAVDPLRRPIGYDRGGFLPPGRLALNTTGRPEALGFDYDKLGKAVAKALREEPPRVAVDDILAGQAALSRRLGGVTR
jgi:hypothetical protein